MKYIRTKDGIYKDGHYFLDGFMGDEKGNIVKEIKIPVHSIIPEEQIIVKADTIEELCDCYVVWLKNRELPLIERTQKGRRLYPSYFEVGECSFDKGFGAIWTDKGLIYVAKMNDKGELELL